MIKVIRKSIIVFSIVLLSYICTLAGNQNSFRGKTHTISLISKPTFLFVTIPICELISNSSLYHNKTVRVSATYINVIPDVVGLYGPDCWDGKIPVSPLLDCDTEGSCKKLQNILNNGLEGDGETTRAEVIITGRFEVRSTPTGNISKYPKYIFYIKEINEIKPVPADIPLPWEKKPKSNFIQCYFDSNRNVNQ